MCGVRRIDRKVREVVEITKETLDRSGLGFGRICVQTEDFSFINKEMEVRLFDRLFESCEGGRGCPDQR